MRVLIRAQFQSRSGFEFALGQGALAMRRGGELHAHDGGYVSTGLINEFARVDVMQVNGLPRVVTAEGWSSAVGNVEENWMVGRSGR